MGALGWSAAAAGAPGSLLPWGAGRFHLALGCPWKSRGCSCWDEVPVGSLMLERGSDSLHPLPATLHPPGPRCAPQGLGGHCAKILFLYRRWEVHQYNN